MILQKIIRRIRRQDKRQLDEACLKENFEKYNEEKTGDKIEEEYTLESFAKEDRTYWRFSQSERGRSEEKEVFAEYIPGEITYAEDPDKGLSFVDDKHIARCCMYGDMLTKLNFDMRDEKFNYIKNEKVRITGSALGEYEARKLLVECNYPLDKVDNIKLLFSMVDNNAQFISIFYYSQSRNLATQLRKFGYEESANLVDFLKEKYDKNNRISPKEMMEHIEVYLNQKG